MLYTLVMAFALVYLGEHYVTDIILGWIYAALAFVWSAASSTGAKPAAIAHC